MNVFISHVAAEASIALALKEVIENAFIDKVSVFASSSTEDLLPGDKWLEKIESQLKVSDVLIVICSPASLTRPWINFELGCGWIRGLKVIPICHAGQRKDRLPDPFSVFQALQMDESEFPNSLLMTLSKKLGLHRPPVVDLKRAKKAIDRAIAAAQVTDSVPQVITSLRDRTRVVIDDLQKLLRSGDVKNETVWLSAFLSILAAGPEDEFPPDEQDYLELLMKEREILLKLARKGCKIRCVISPPNPNHVRHEQSEYAIKRIDRLIQFLESSDAALESIEVAISDLSVKNLYIVGHISCIEGYKLAIRRGYGLTLRQTMPEVIDANIKLQSELFDNLSRQTERKWGVGKPVGTRRDDLRAAAIYYLREAQQFVRISTNWSTETPGSDRPPGEVPY